LHETLFIFFFLRWSHAGEAAVGAGIIENLFINTDSYYWWYLCEAEKKMFMKTIFNSMWNYTFDSITHLQFSKEHTVHAFLIQ
jgi:hypothetical protein